MRKQEETMEHSTDKLMEDLMAVVAGAEALLKATASQTGERITAARAMTEESLQAAKVRMTDAQAAAVEQAKLAVKTTDDYVHGNPWQAVGIAVVVGLALGAIITRR